MRTDRALPIILAALIALQAGAEAGELDGAEIEDLLREDYWRVESGASDNFFVWRSDGTLCVKVHAPGDEGCDDAGPWKQDGDRLCYELEWWGKAYGMHEACMRVSRSQGGAYEMIDANGL
ncbi:MAG: hypothetical protein R3316_12595, partial [Rhodovibrionaceae bacterium]|nr:hypothetical protein [Rhodovibrionaceae bacterium]